MEKKKDDFDELVLEVWAKNLTKLKEAMEGLEKLLGTRKSKEDNETWKKRLN